MASSGREFGSSAGEFCGGGRDIWGVSGESVEGGRSGVTAGERLRRVVLGGSDGRKVGMKAMMI